MSKAQKKEDKQFGSGRLWLPKRKRYNDLKEQILIIKHGALGDFILALGPIAAIRKTHPDACITLVTTAPFAKFAEDCPYVDEVVIDPRPKFHQPIKWAKLRRRLRRQWFQRVYDLQTSDRSNIYRKFLKRRPDGTPPEWSGTAKGCSHPDTNPERTLIHTLERQKIQLNLAGIANVPRADLSWIEERWETVRVRFGLKQPLVVLVPGGSAHRPDKRWSATAYAQLAEHLIGLGMHVALVGTSADEESIQLIYKRCPSVSNLCNATDFYDLVDIGRNAILAVGNDTGPMHLFAASGSPTVTLFSNASNPDRCRPRGPKNDDANLVVQVESLQALEVKEVIQTIEQLLET